ncbi:hypothetical protein [Mycobacteroides abscessus]|uniref:hypothetical protein n=1 Tax=Mycobacteroides abscessus TaxID=36809 RepID=UPI0005170ADB|nr:hypothetical protein [Mycobacteroides abscessus]ORA29088.1 hypothetical protein BST18_08910 [Mycobacteroides abscessus subsp. bolletii]TPF70286.1 hypothetical protein XW60_00670 [Mycobacteroides abscessus subsp. bolletii]BBB42325.1 hypothetical protein MASB_28910 [Mycobacteroides abscessus subsp. bolletii BD]
MDVGIGPLVGLAGRASTLIQTLIGSPIRVQVLEGEERQQVIRDAQIPALAIPRWVPGDPEIPPAVEMFDAQRLYMSIDEVAREQHWLPVDRDRIVLHIYNKSDDAVFFKKIRATAQSVPVQQPRRGCVIGLGAGGGEVSTFRLAVNLYTDRPCQVESLGSEGMHNLTARNYQLAPRESVHLIVDADIGLDETAEMVDWCLWFELDANRSLRSARRLRVPAKRKYVVGRPLPFRIIRQADAPLYLTQSNSGGFAWHRDPRVKLPLSGDKSASG